MAKATARRTVPHTYFVPSRAHHMTLHPTTVSVAQELETNDNSLDYRIRTNVFQIVNCVLLRLTLAQCYRRSRRPPPARLASGFQCQFLNLHLSYLSTLRPRPSDDRNTVAAEQLRETSSDANYTIRNKWQIEKQFSFDRIRAFAKNAPLNANQ